MANVQNLRPVRSKEEARERGRNGGIASGKARRAYKTAAEIAKEIGEEIVAKDAQGNERTFMEQITREQYKKAAGGDTQAYIALVRARGEDKTTIDVQQEVPIRLIDDGLD